MKCSGPRAWITHATNSESQTDQSEFVIVSPDNHRECIDQVVPNDSHLYPEQYLVSQEQHQP